MSCTDISSSNEYYAGTDNSNSTLSTSSSSALSTPHRHTPVDNNWHFNFEIQWSKVPSEITRKLENKERPTGHERREMIRLMVGEILTVCPTPGKKHVSEIARKIVSTYPLSFIDVIEDQVVGSGYDSLTKQLQSRVTNMKRGKTSLYLKRQAASTSEEEEDLPSKTTRVDTYGCINWQPNRLPPGETVETQKFTQEELKNMHENRSKDTKSTEKKMVATFYTQRSNIISGMDTPVLVREWPYLFEMCGMMAHFKELTGSSPLTAGHFMIAVDQTIVNGTVPNFGGALVLMFATYYCLNISYPAELGATLEFLQR
ncbi:hypothetical protein LDENG_00275120 [Lucifuga dentata]|nr:hypothetical protein LDENG_00275120 [Lucifuga dentata]